MSILLTGSGLAAALCAGLLVEKRRRRTHPVVGGLHTEISIPYTDTLELYSNPFSHCSRKTRLVFVELGLPYRHIPIDLIETGQYETISPHYLKINPAGLVPTLVHSGHPVYESDDILVYATEQAGPSAPRLVPEDEAARAVMNAWIKRGSIASGEPLHHIQTSAGSCVAALTIPLFATSIQHVSFRQLLPGFFFHPNKERPAFFAAAKVLGLRRLLSLPWIHRTLRRARDAMTAHLSELLSVLDRSGGPWIMGTQYTLADVSWTCILVRLEETGWLQYYIDTHGLHELQRYYERLQARPSFAQAITHMRHPTIEKGAADLSRATQHPAVARALYA